MDKLPDFFLWLIDQNYRAAPQYQSAAMKALTAMKGDCSRADLLLGYAATLTASRLMATKYAWEAFMRFCQSTATPCTVFPTFREVHEVAHARMAHNAKKLPRVQKTIELAKLMKLDPLDVGEAHFEMTKHFGGKLYLFVEVKKKKSKSMYYRIEGKALALFDELKSEYYPDEKQLCPLPPHLFRHAAVALQS